jgi:hypothetical protein
MTSHELDLIVEMLKMDPGTVYITPSGKAMLLLVGPEDKLMYIQARDDQNFSIMTQDEIETIVKRFLS